MGSDQSDDEGSFDEMVVDDEIDMVQPPPAKKSRKKKGKQIDATAIEHSAEAIGTLLDETAEVTDAGQAQWERKRTRPSQNGSKRKMSKKAETFKTVKLM